MIAVIIAVSSFDNSLRYCLDSIFTQAYNDFKVVVVNNGLNDVVIQPLEKKYPNILIVKNRYNLGACMARNQGIDASREEWVLTLDSDVVLGEDFLIKSVELLKRMPSEIGMVQPKILSIDRKKIYSCGIYLSYLMRFYDIGMGKKEAGSFNKPRDIFGACSAAAFYRRKMLEEIKEPAGYFDERFFFLVEDVDLAWRAQNKGWKAVFNPALVCFHEGNSSNTKKEARQYLCFRNRFFAIIKNEKSFTRKAFSLVIYDIPRIIYLIFVNRFTFKALKEIFDFSRRLNDKADYNPPS